MLPISFSLLCLSNPSSHTVVFPSFTFCSLLHEILVSRSITGNHNCYIKEFIFLPVWNIFLQLNTYVSWKHPIAGTIKRNQWCQNGCLREDPKYLSVKNAPFCFPVMLKDVETRQSAHHFGQSGRLYKFGNFTRRAHHLVFPIALKVDFHRRGLFMAKKILSMFLNFQTGFHWQSLFQVYHWLFALYQPFRNLKYKLAP